MEEMIKEFKCKCGNKRLEYRTLCDGCLEKSRFEKAKKINIKDYQDNFIYDINTERYFQDIDDLEEYYEDEEMELPDYVYGCVAIEFNLDMYGIVQDELLDNHFEDAYDFVDMDSLNNLQKIVDEWTKAQGIVSYEKDYNLAILLNK